MDGRASPSMSLTSSRRSSVTLQAARRLRVLSITPVTLLVVIWLVCYRGALFGSQDAIALTGSQPELASNPTDSTYLPPGLANQPDHQIEKAAQKAAEEAAKKAAEAAKKAAEAAKKAAEEAAKKAADEAAKEAAERERETLAKEAFISDFLTTDIRGAYDGQALYDLCAAGNATWDQNIIFECPHLDGGYGNVRNAALQCIRLAIEARGSLVMPHISKRSQQNIGDFRTGDMRPFSYLFDIRHLKRTLKTYCPQLKIHDSVPDQPSLNTPLPLNPVDLPGLTRAGRLITSPSKVKSEFDSWLKKTNKNNLSPVLITLQVGIIWSWPTSYDPASFVRSFSRIVRFSREVRTLAAEALYNLQTSHLPSTKPSSSSESSFTLPFIGIHLRAEKDAAEYHLTNYTLQADYYIARLRTDIIRDASFASADNTVPIYVASGDRNQIAAFTNQLSTTIPETHFRFLTKDLLLDPGQLMSLTWDQQALIDYQIMERASYVMGVRESSFAWTLALKRAAAANWVVGGFPSGPCWTVAEDEDGRGLTGGRGEVRGKRRGCKEDLAPYEYWRDHLTALVGDLGEAANESVDVVRSSIWP